MNRRPEYPQLPLPGMPDSAPYSNRDTSMDAAIEITMHLARLEEIVLTEIRQAGARGLCDHEGEAATGLIHQTYSARRRTLVIKGMVVEGAEKRTTPSGRKSIAWVITQTEGQPS